MSSALDAATVARRVRDLPALPAALSEVLVALRSNALRTDRFAQLIEHDQALCGRTLRLANSAFYGLSGRVGSAHDAVQLLGLRTVANVMSAASLAGYAHVGRCAGFDFRVFWRHSMAVSIAAREIGMACGFDGDQACVAGLMHDAGYLAMAAYFPDSLSSALDLSRGADCALIEAEHTVLGLDHTQVGSMVAQHWCLPPAIVEAIQFHHQPPAGAQPPASCWLIDTVHLADAMAHALDVARASDECVPVVSLDSWERLGIGRLDTAHIFASVEQGVDSLSAALEL
jgi:putative nucleotidyltransferase with HDIG domain